jgi:general secretion pathway protein G
MKLLQTPRRSRRAAFTLIEVLVVVAILVILAGVGIVGYMRYMEDAKKTQAALQCKSIEQACQAYYMNSQSGGNYPTQLTDLIMPFGGSGGMQSYLKNGQQDLLDPWRNQFQFKIVQGQDGTQQPLVYTIAPDQTPISNHGIGMLSQLQ